MIFLDEDDSIKYRIQHVSNGGKRKFYVNPTSGTSRVHRTKSQYIMYNLLYIHTYSTCGCKHLFEEDHGYLSAVELDPDLAFLF